MSDAFPIPNGLKQGDASSPLLFNFVLTTFHQESPWKSGGTATEWNTSAPVYADML